MEWARLGPTLPYSPPPTYPQGQPGVEHYQVQCKLSLLEKQFKTAESILLEQGQVEETLRMYRQLHKWDQTLAVARAKVRVLAGQAPLPTGLAGQAPLPTVLAGQAPLPTVLAGQAPLPTVLAGQAPLPTVLVHVSHPSSSASP